VVVTGIGGVTSLGNTIERPGRGSSTDSPARADHAVRPQRLPVHFACEVKDFDPADWIDRKRRGGWTASRT
jgi:3-oxoacyl-[acyl-carrier-protein] synthase II